MRHLQNALVKSLRQGDFKVYYQPKVNSVAGCIAGAEAFIRWQHRSKGLISPGEFIPVFEKNGFVLTIDLFVFERVCRLLAETEKNDRYCFPISCNFSRLHFINGVLSEIQFDVVKFDRSLIYNAEKFEYNKLILTGMAKTIHSLGKKSSAKGLKTSVK